MGFPMLDPLASVVICLFVVKAAVDIFRDAISKMTDKSCDQETVNEMHDCIMNIQGVEGIDLLKTRSFGSKYYVDICLLYTSQQLLYIGSRWLLRSRI